MDRVINPVCPDCGEAMAPGTMSIENTFEDVHFLGSVYPLTNLVSSTASHSCGHIVDRNQVRWRTICD